MNATMTLAEREIFQRNQDAAAQERAAEIQRRADDVARQRAIEVATGERDRTAADIHNAQAAVLAKLVAKQLAADAQIERERLAARAQERRAYEATLAPLRARLAARASQISTVAIPAAAQDIAMHLRGLLAAIGRWDAAFVELRKISDSDAGRGLNTSNEVGEIAERFKPLARELFASGPGPIGRARDFMVAIVRNF